MKKAVVFLIFIFCRVFAGEAQQAAAYFPFNGNAQDNSGNLNHASSTGGAVLTTDKNNKPNAAYAFDGSNVITVPNSASLATGNSMSIAALVKPSATPPAVNGQNVFAILSKDEGAGNNNRKWIFGLQNGKLAFHINSENLAAGYWFYSNAFTLTVGEFAHYALTKQGNTITFYLNGVAIGERIIPADLRDPSAPLRIGYAEGAMYMQGTIDEVRLYNTVLDQPDITALPVKISSFYCSMATKYPTLFWTTSVQENVNRYEIEKSTDGRSFRVIGFRAALQNIFSYNLPDSEAVSARFNYYRIKVIDNDGRKTFSRVIRIGTKERHGLAVRSKPGVKGSFMISNAGSAQDITVSVFSAGGALMLSERISLAAGQTKEKPLRVSPGIYVVAISDAAGSRVLTERIIIN